MANVTPIVGTEHNHTPLADGDRLAGTTIQISTDAGNAITEGADGGLYAPVPAPSFGRLVGIKSFTVSDTYTPASNVTAVKVIVTGGGGSGYAKGAALRGAGGGAGGTAIRFIQLPNHAPIQITVGVGGTSDTDHGKPSYFGDIFYATGGTSGSRAGGASLGAGGPGGVGINGDINIQGGYGSDAETDVAINGGGSGDGGASYWGGGQRSTARSPLINGSFGGGGGGSADDVSFGAGMPGVVYIEEYS